MKKAICTIMLSAALAYGISGIAAYNGASIVKAEGGENYTEVSVTIRNNTPFELENVDSDFGLTETVGTESIKPYSEVTVQIPEKVKHATMLKISGTTSEGTTFTNTFNGWMSDDTVVTVQYDEEKNLSVSSNINEN